MQRSARHVGYLLLLLPLLLRWHCCRCYSSRHWRGILVWLPFTCVHRLERALLLPTPCRRRLPAGQPPDAAGDLRRRQDVGAAHRAGGAGAKGAALVFSAALVLLCLYCWPCMARCVPGSRAPCRWHSCTRGFGWCSAGCREPKAELPAVMGTLAGRDCTHARPPNAVACRARAPAAASTPPSFYQRPLLHASLSGSCASLPASPGRGLQLPLQLHLLQRRRGLDRGQARHPAAHHRRRQELGAHPPVWCALTGLHPPAAGCHVTCCTPATHVERGSRELSCQLSAAHILSGSARCAVCEWGCTGMPVQRPVDSRQLTPACTPGVPPLLLQPSCRARLC